MTAATFQSRTFLTAVAAALAWSSVAAAQDVVKLGFNGVISDAVFYIAQEHGYFAEQKVKVEFVHFDNGPKMIAPLGAGQLDAGAGAQSAGLYNAVGRGINIKMVADKGSTPPGYEYMQILVRKDLVDSGKIKTHADFKGLKIATGGEGGSQNVIVNELLKKGGLKFKDVEHVFMGYPQHIGALANGAVDFSITAEPAAAMALATGKAVRFSDVNPYPDQQVAVLLYGGDFIAKRRDVAQRFMTAYVKAARYYNDALKDGKFAGRNAEDVIKIIIANTKLKNRDLYDKLTPNGLNVDGRLNMESLAKDLAFYKEQGYIEKPIELAAAVDNSFVENAVKALGPYKPNK